MRFAFLCLALSLPLPALAAGDVLQIPLSQQGDSKLPRPGKGMSKAEVEKLFGAPAQVQGPVGQPPITRWHYPEYVVTFEYDHVVHTVLKHKPKAPVNATDPATDSTTEPTPTPTGSDSTQPVTPATPTPSS
ncbi:MAG TPA: hypothetical protein VFV64_13415 [Permianibacter sp.]|nr:hypothetical protein [Permianibacter sp.]